jgi:hypothetical protein
MDLLHDITLLYSTILLPLLDQLGLPFDNEALSLKTDVDILLLHPTDIESGDNRSAIPRFAKRGTMIRIR